MLICIFTYGYISLFISFLKFKVGLKFIHGKLIGMGGCYTVLIDAKF